MCFEFPLHTTGQVARASIQQALGCLTAQLGSTQGSCTHRQPQATDFYLVQLLTAIKKLISIPNIPLLYSFVVMKATKVTYHNISSITRDGEDKSWEVRQQHNCWEHLELFRCFPKQLNVWTMHTWAGLLQKTRFIVFFLNFLFKSFFSRKPQTLSVPTEQLNFSKPL